MDACSSLDFTDYEVLRGVFCDTNNGKMYRCLLGDLMDEIKPAASVWTLIADPRGDSYSMLDCLSGQLVNRCLCGKESCSMH